MVIKVENIHWKIYHKKAAIVSGVKLVIWRRLHDELDERQSRRLVEEVHFSDPRNFSTFW